MQLPQKPPKTVLPTSSEKLEAVLAQSSLVRGKYLHWDKLRHLSPPAPLSHEEWWTGIKLARAHQLKEVPLTDKNGQPFMFSTPDPLLQMLHWIDQESSGQIRIDEEVTNHETRTRYVVNSLIEEAVTSSQLEGASTTVDVAKRMIRSGRRPSDRSEQMVLNNYRAMRLISERGSGALTPELVCEIHGIVTRDTLDDPGKAGALRTKDDEIQIVGPYGTVLHIPPQASELADRLAALCAFANDRPTEIFLHPVVRAVILHFQMGYDHPFVDGNGRTARALFYWSMLSQGYWLAEYLSISRILKEARAKYARAFLYTESDSNDLTYFIDHNLSVVVRGIRDLGKYLERKVAEVKVVEELLAERSRSFNHRQLALLSHALRHPGDRYTIQSQQNSHGVVYDTARTDLLDLAKRGLLNQARQGRGYVFFAPSDVEVRLRALES